MEDKHSRRLSRYLWSVLEKQQKISLDDLQHQIRQYCKENHIKYPPGILSILEEGRVEVKDGFAYALPLPPLENIKSTVNAFVTVHPNQRVSNLNRFLCEFYKIGHFRQLGQGKIDFFFGLPRLRNHTEQAYPQSPPTTTGTHRPLYQPARLCHATSVGRSL